MRANLRSYSTAPIAAELSALYQTIPDVELLASLKTYYAGRRGYGLKVLWRTYIAQAYLNLPSIAALIRQLQDNPALREACGIATASGVPSKFAYSRFLRKLNTVKAATEVKDVFRALSRECYRTFPDFSKSVAIDSVDVKAWSNGRHPVPTDPSAGWVVKDDTHGRKKFVWGFKVHVVADTKHELPIAAIVTAGNVSDVTKATNVLAQARFACKGHADVEFRPQYVICDAGYSSEELRHKIREYYWAQPIIKVNKQHKKALRREPETPEFRAIYNRRSSVERVFSRLKSHRRLNNVTVRGLRKVTNHVFVSLIVQVAWALVMPETPRQLVRAA